MQVLEEDNQPRDTMMKWAAQITLIFLSSLVAVKDSDLVDSFLNYKAALQVDAHKAVDTLFEIYSRHSLTEIGQHLLGHPAAVPTKALADMGKVVDLFNVRTACALDHLMECQEAIFFLNEIASKDAYLSQCRALVEGVKGDITDEELAGITLCLSMHSLKYPFEYLSQLNRIPQPVALLTAIQNNHGLCAAAVAFPSNADSLFCFRPIQKLQRVFSELKISEDGPEQVKRSLEIDCLKDLKELFSHSKESITVDRSLRYLAKSCRSMTEGREEGVYQAACRLINLHKSGRG